MEAVCLTLLALLSLPTQGRPQGWRVYTPPDKSFSVELPAPLTRVKSFDGEHGINFDTDWDMRGITSYAAIETTLDDCRFGIVVVSGKARKMFLRSSRPGRERFWYLSVIFIGDDDDATPDEEGEVRVNGLNGREYFYIRDGVSNTGEIHTRGRIFDAGGRLYVVVFVGQKTDDLRSPDAERFLNSFRAHGHRRSPRN